MGNEVSKVSGWVEKAVAQVAAFDGKNNKISDAEEVALGELLRHPDLSEADREYIEGFMLDKHKQVSSPLEEQNTDRVVDVPVGPLSAKDEEQLKRLTEMYNRTQLFFDENGHIIKSETKGKNGEITHITNMTRLDNGDIELKCVQQEAFVNWVTEYDGIHHNDGFEMKNRVTKENGNLIEESHKLEDGTIVTTTYVTASEENPVCKVQSAFQNGKVVQMEIDVDGNTIYKKGIYEADKYGNIISIQFPTRSTTEEQ